MKIHKIFRTPMKNKILLLFAVIINVRAILNIQKRYIRINKKQIRGCQKGGRWKEGKGTGSDWLLVMGFFFKTMKIFWN